jgi:DNA-directed RNA polymerase specialized sigma24 family protein
MPRRHEITFSEHYRASDGEPTDDVHSVHEPRSFSEFETLMRGDQGPSVESLAPLREVLADALDGLTPKERWVFDALVIEGLSLRQLGKQLGHGDPPHFGKTHMARLRDSIFDKLRAALEGDPLVRRYLK